MITLEFKKAVHQYCLGLVFEKLKAIEVRISETRSALDSEQKSSAGDKHETGRAMIQLEQEKLGMQHQSIEKEFLLLKRIHPHIHLDSVQVGSLVQTDSAIYYISIGLGQIQHDNTRVFVMAPNAPLSQHMLELNEGDQFEFRGVHHQIDFIC